MSEALKFGFSIVAFTAVCVGINAFMIQVSTHQPNIRSCYNHALLDRAEYLFLRDDTAPKLDTFVDNKLVIHNAYNVRENPYFNATESRTTDDWRLQCMEDIITNRGDYVLYYGWTEVNGHVNIIERSVRK